MSKEKEMDKEKFEKTDLQRAAESFAKYRTPEINFQKDYIQQSHNGPVTEEEEEIDMCQAVDEMIEDGREICRRDGKSG